MGISIRFRANGEDLAYDVEADISAADLWALDEMGMTEGELAAAFDRAAELENADPADAATLQLGTRALCAMVFLAHRRAGGRTSWQDYSRTLRPAQIEVLGVDQPPANRAERRAAAKQGKRKTAPSKVGEALADAGAGEPVAVAAD